MSKMIDSEKLLAGIDSMLTYGKYGKFIPKSSVIEIIRKYEQPEPQGVDISDIIAKKIRYDFGSKYSHGTCLYTANNIIEAIRPYLQTNTQGVDLESIFTISLDQLACQMAGYVHEKEMGDICSFNSLPDAMKHIKHESMRNALEAIRPYLQTNTTQLKELEKVRDLLMHCNKRIMKDHGKSTEEFIYQPVDEALTIINAMLNQGEKK